jgi:hypothetical protein
MWKEVVIAYSKVLNRNFTGRNKRNRKKKSKVNISFSIEILENLVECLKSIRSEEGFKQLLVDATKTGRRY